MKKDDQARRDALVRAAGNGAKMVAIVVTLSCSGQQPEGKAVKRGGPDDDQGNIAHAATPVDAGDDVSQLIDSSSDSNVTAMPKNPSHISFRIPRVPSVKVGYLSENKYPYQVVHEGDKTIVTIFPPQGMKIMVAISSLDENGDPTGDTVRFTVNPKAKLGTYDLQVGETSKDLNFGEEGQVFLGPGTTTLDGPSRDEFVGVMDKVKHSVYIAGYDQICSISWEGCEEVRSILDGPAQPHVEQFTIPLKAGEELGFYPVTPNGESVDVHIEPQEPAEE